MPTGWLCGISPSGARAESRWLAALGHEAALVEIPEQPDRAGPSRRKQRIAVMLGFKGFRHAAITIAGIELMHRIRNGQFGLGHLDVQGRTASAVWNAALGA